MILTALVNYVTDTEILKIQKQPPEVFLKIKLKFHKIHGKTPTPGLFWREDKNDVDITQTNFMRFIFSMKKVFLAQWCCLPSNTTFPNTSNRIIFLRRSEEVVPRCSSRKVFLKFSKFQKNTPALESF